MGLAYKSEGQVGPVPDFSPASWSALTWALYAIGVLYLLGFLVFFFRIEGAARSAQTGGSQAIAKYNRILRGFPNALFARMLGRRPMLERVAD